MNADKLFKAIVNRPEITNIPIKYVVAICVAVIEELPNCIDKEDVSYV